MTNAMNIANELAVRPQMKIVVTGGVARPQSYELIGPLVDRCCSGLTLDFTILGVDGMTPGSARPRTTKPRPAPTGSRRVRQHGHRGGRQLEAGPPGVRPDLQTAARSVLVTDRDAPEDVVEEFTALGIDVLRV